MRRHGLIASFTALGVMMAAGSGVVVVTQGAQASASGPACDQHAAINAVSSTSLGQKMVEVPHSTPWAITNLYCHDVAGAGGSDMTVLFGCCTTGAPTPLAILRPRHGRWYLSYSSWKPLVYRLTLKHRTLIEKRPDYDRGDPLCCPDGFTYWSLRWNRAGWTVRRR